MSDNTSDTSVGRRKLLAGAGTVTLAGLAGCLGIGTPRSESSYTGYIVDNEYQKGLIFANTKILLKTHPTSSENEEFFIKIPGDEDLYDKAEQALREQRRVTVTYRRSFFENPFDAFSNASIATDIEVHDETAEDTDES